MSKLPSPDSRGTPAVLRVLFWGCLVAIVGLSIMPANEPLPTTGWDKANHLLAFATATVLGCLAYGAAMPVLLAGLIAFGGFVEVLQWFTPHRHAEWGDLIADVLGMVLGLGLVRLMSAPQRRRVTRRRLR